METGDYMAEVHRSGQLLAAAADGHLDVSVPTCPDWVLADLVFHLGSVQSRWTLLGTGAARVEDLVAPERPADDELVDWFRSGVDATVEALGSVDPTVERWNWSGADQTAGWIQRRMAHEAAVHGWDGANAVGRPEPIPTPVAVDGIDEFFDVFVSARSAAFEGAPESIHVHCTDGEGEWVLTTGSGQVVVERIHAKGDVAVRGPAGDLLLTLWSRGPRPEVEVIGDADGLARFLTTVTI
jgi:uncharacterized protein (TIGR03083 family)